TEVSLYLGEGLAGGADTTAGQDASPPADEAAASEVTVEIVDFEYAPDPVEITAGFTVTWVNRDSVPHTATGDGGSFQSGTLRTDESFSSTFDEPGTYEYFCEFHANMSGTVIVT
ncbi:MAG TPA: cupredoxin family copper-binding protein, partial [Chloroflexota bacterium]|nr:cupredoxin family copper-binding protein [Chloroflexota bacterium]